MNLEHCTERWESLGDDRLKRACKLAYHIEKCLGVKTTNSFEKFWMPCCSNWFADFTCEEVKEYVMSTKGRPMLMDQNGYIYVNLCTKTVDQSRIYWRCRLKGSCNAKAVTYHHIITRKTGIHNHPPSS